MNPIDGGTIGRVDQGVDISGSPGATIRDPVPGTSRYHGVTDHNWYHGQPFNLFEVIDGPFRGKYWYVAEQVDVQMSPGQTVSLGQKIGVYAASGSATEWGWATSSGQTLAMATTGYHEGQQTPAGLDFLNNIIKGAGKAMPGGATGISRPGGGTDTGAQIDALFKKWDDEINMPRRVPKSTPSDLKNPLKWWLKSFRGKYGAE